jgi:hypothetical protein
MCQTNWAIVPGAPSPTPSTLWGSRPIQGPSLLGPVSFAKRTQAAGGISRRGVLRNEPKPPSSPPPHPVRSFRARCPLVSPGGILRNEPKPGPFRQKTAQEPPFRAVRGSDYPPQRPRLGSFRKTCAAHPPAQIAYDNRNCNKLKRGVQRQTPRDPQAAVAGKLVAVDHRHV